MSFYLKEPYEDTKKLIELARSPEYVGIAYTFSELELKCIEKRINLCRLAGRKSVGASAICPECEHVYCKLYPNQVFCCEKCRSDFAFHINTFKTRMNLNSYLHTMYPDYDAEQNAEEWKLIKEDLS